MKNKRPSVAHQQELIDYVLELSSVKRKDVRFVILDGSTAEGKDRRYSDYDVSVVKKGSSGPKGPVQSLYAPTGLFRGRMVTGWLLDDESFKRYYIGTDDEQFVWRRRQLRKARLLFGDIKCFDRIMRPALARRWNRKRQFAVVRPSYVEMVEYLGKMLNKPGQAATPEFFQDGFIIATHAALLVAALNKIDLDSDKIMYQQVFAGAKVRPPNFERDFKIVSGLTDSSREKKAVVAASKRLVRWARERIKESFEPGDPNDRGFWQLVRDMRF